jgi:hypothetical protein
MTLRGLFGGWRSAWLDPVASPSTATRIFPASSPPASHLTHAALGSPAAALLQAAWACSPCRAARCGAQPAIRQRGHRRHHRRRLVSERPPRFPAEDPKPSSRPSSPPTAGAWNPSASSPPGLQPRSADAVDRQEPHRHLGIAPASASSPAPCWPPCSPQLPHRGFRDAPDLAATSPAPS